VPDNQLKLFADDINLFVFGSDYDELEVKCSNYLEMMNLWFLANKLSININKTCYSTFSMNRMLSTGKDLNLFIGTQKVCKSTNCKYLGVFIDEHLNWKVHIDYVYKKTLRFAGVFYRIRDVISFGCLKKLYFAFVNPH